MLLKDVKGGIADKHIDGATVFRVPVKNDPVNGYQYKVVFEEKGGDRFILTRQRGGARTFSAFSAVENVLLDVGIQFFVVIMLEYQIDAYSVKNIAKGVLEEYDCSE